MAASAHDVAAAIRARMPGVAKVKLQKLLYYCQGHHLAHFGEPLFHEAIEAWDNGPVVADFWRAEDRGEHIDDIAKLDNAQLNTIGYVLSRYGGNTGADLIRLTHNESPWKEARPTRFRRAHNQTISNDSMRDFFCEIAAVDAREDEVQLDPDSVARFLAGARERAQRPAKQDDLHALRARVTRG